MALSRAYSPNRYSRGGVRADDRNKMDRADLHFHLLPGIDDGVASIEESVALAATAAADGTRAIVATPHIRPGFVTDVSQLSERIRELDERLAREGVEISVH